MAEDTQINNVVDFTAYRIQRNAESLWEKGDTKSAEIMWDALEAYLQGLCEVQFIEGKTYLKPVDLDFGEDNKNKSV